MFVRKFSALHLQIETLDVLSGGIRTRLGGMKVSSSIYKGIQYVQVSALPVEQRDRLLGTINTELFIKILVDGKVIGNCLQFKDYEKWFENVYRPVGTTEGVNARVNHEKELVQLAPDAASH